MRSKIAKPIRTRNRWAPRNLTGVSLFPAHYSNVMAADTLLPEPEGRIRTAFRDLACKNTGIVQVLCSELRVQKV